MNPSLSGLTVLRKVLAALAVAALVISTFGFTLTQNAQAAVVKEPTDPQNVPATKDDCKDGGWEQYGFSNQGLCIAWVNHQNGEDGDDDGDGDGDSATSTVTIVKYVDGAHATAGNAGGASFGMESSWDDPDGIGSGSGSFNLDANGGYEAVTSPMTTDEADYATHEVLDGSTVGEACMEEGGPDFKLVGYTMGDSLNDAEEATPSMTAPSFTDLDDDMYVIVWNEACDGDTGGGDDTVNVIIDKYVDGVQATADNASSTTFNLIADYDAVVSGNHISGSDPYTIGPVGNGSPNAYEAMTLNFDQGADYGTHEVVGNSTTGASCQDGKQFALTGYTWGDSLAAAAAMTPTSTAPSFDNLQSDKYVIVWNDNCNNNGTGGPGDDSATSTVTIIKYVDGVHATAGNASSSSFGMHAAWSDPNGIGSSTGNFNLGPASYEAVTSPLTTGEADYATNEILDGTIVGSSCTASSSVPAFRLVGYTWGDSLAAAQAGTATTTSPNLTNINGNKFIIVWNASCAATSTATTTDAALHVDSIDAQKTTAIANDTYADGWRYVFHITTPNSEENLSMRFSNWVGDNASNTIAVANNMRLSSAQASSTSPVTLVGANIYSTPPFVMMTDLDPATPGRQVEVLVEVKIPVGTQNDNYTTTYGVQTLP